MNPSSGEIPIVPHSVCFEEWRGWRERFAKLWESLSLGLNHLDLAVELMDLILSRGCRSDCRGSPVCPLDWSPHEDGRAVLLMVSTINHYRGTCMTRIFIRIIYVWSHHFKSLEKRCRHTDRHQDKHCSYMSASNYCSNFVLGRILKALQHFIFSRIRIYKLVCMDLVVWQDCEYVTIFVLLATSHPFMHMLVFPDLL